MHHVTACSTALSLAMLGSPSAAAQIDPAPGARTGAAVILAQGETRVPSDANLERMQERAITTPPIDADRTGGTRVDQDTEIRRMDERDRRLDQELMNSGAICRDCK